MICESNEIQIIPFVYTLHVSLVFGVHFTFTINFICFFLFHLVERISSITCTFDLMIDFMSMKILTELWCFQITILLISSWWDPVFITSGQLNEFIDLIKWHVISFCLVSPAEFTSWLCLCSFTLTILTHVLHLTWICGWNKSNEIVSIKLTRITYLCMYHRWDLNHLDTCKTKHHHQYSKRHISIDLDNQVSQDHIVSLVSLEKTNRYHFIQMFREKRKKSDRKTSRNTIHVNGREKKKISI